MSVDDRGVRQIHRGGGDGDGSRGQPTAQQGQLKRSMGLAMAIALVVGNMIGSGVFLLPSSLAGVVQAHGSASLLAWVFTGLGAMLLALVFASLGRAYPQTGGPYVYARRGMGEFIGFWTGWGYWLAVWIGNAAIAVAFVGYFSVFWPELGTNNLLASLVGIAVIWVLTFTNILGARQGGTVQLVTTVLKFVPLLLIGIIGIFFVDSSNYGPWAPHGATGSSGAVAGITAAATLTLWAFIGLESATVPAEEVENPERTIPLSTILGTAVTTVVYILATIAVMGVIPVGRLVSSNSPFAAAAGEIFGGSWNKVIALVAMISTFGALNGWILLSGRVPLAAARDGLFPKQFGAVDKQRGTPVFGLVVSSVLASILMLMNYSSSLVDQFTYIILLATLATLIPYAFSAISELLLFITDRQSFPALRLARDVVVALLAFAYSVWTIVGSGYDIIAKGFVLLIVAMPIYVYLKWQQSREATVVVPDADDTSRQPTPSGARP
jgi:APA family basic amino acid/polyamine antiporter